MNAVRTRFCSNCHQLTTSSLSAVINCLSPSVVSPPLPVIITRWHPTFLCGNDRAGGLLPSRTIQELSGCHSIAPDLSVQWWLAVKAYFTGVDKTSISGEVCVGFTFLRTVRSPRHPHCLLPECAEPSPQVADLALPRWVLPSAWPRSPPAVCHGNPVCSHSDLANWRANSKTSSPGG